MKEGRKICWLLLILFRPVKSAIAFSLSFFFYKATLVVIFACIQCCYLSFFPSFLPPFLSLLEEVIPSAEALAAARGGHIWHPLRAPSV